MEVEPLDLDEDWDLLRKRPAAPPPQPKGAEDIDADWRALQNLPPLPKSLYLVLGDEFTSVQLWELTCHGERKENREGRLLDCWIIKFERCLWRAPHASPVVSTGTGRRVISDFSKQYTTPKNEAYFAVEQAVAQIEKIRDAYLTELKRRRATQLAEMKRLEREMAGVERSLAWGGSVDVGLHVLETARARLLGVFQAQQSRLLGLLQARVEGVVEEDALPQRRQGEGP